MAKFARSRRPSFRTLLSAICKRCRPALRRGVKASNADHYAKRYMSADFALALVVHFLKSTPSLRALQIAFSRSGRLTDEIKLGGISNAQLAQLPHHRPAALWGPLLAELLALLAREDRPSELRVLDSTFFKLGTRLMSRRWQRHFAPEAAGIKLTAVIDPAGHVPLAWKISAGGGSDAAEGPAVLPDEDICGQIYVFDRGFRNYAFYQQLIDRGADLLTRASANMHYEVTRCRDLDPAQPQIVCDQEVMLGSANGRNRMKSRLRRIVLDDGKGRVVFLSSIFDLSAVELCELYRQRWQIEVFFRWLKRQIGCLRPLGYSPQAAEHTILAALVAYLLVRLLELASRSRADRPTGIAAIIHRLRADLDQPPETIHLQVLRL